MKYIVDTNESTIYWEGRNEKMTNKGKVDLHSGEIIINEKGQIEDALLTIDLTTIKVTSDNLDKEDKEKLINHLNSPDFFYTENHKMINFKMTEASIDHGSGLIKGVATLKEASFDMTIPCRVFKENNSFVAEGEFELAKISQPMHKYLGEDYDDDTPGTKIIYHVKAKS
ncbi:YceI family protein [Mangrovivirga sp. M17]|uniref:YceI family protein n=1 Tax=Mangrovivirga halotolerans TaxID=2993936 RepID=A0ABT3RN49_9BACT|nr:YceI family protein [Mangrovivirga halotolerans]MCX2743240.1 YceI family protein [Mangrovivirga halotolerans]